MFADDGFDAAQLPTDAVEPAGLLERETVVGRVTPTMKQANIERVSKLFLSKTFSAFLHQSLAFSLPVGLVIGAAVVALNVYLVRGDCTGVEIAARLQASQPE